MQCQDKNILSDGKSTAVAEMQGWIYKAAPREAETDVAVITVNVNGVDQQQQAACGIQKKKHGK